MNKKQKTENSNILMIFIVIWLIMFTAVYILAYDTGLKIFFNPDEASELYRQIHKVVFCFFCFLITVLHVAMFAFCRHIANSHEYPEWNYITFLEECDKEINRAIRFYVNYSIVFKGLYLIVFVLFIPLFNRGFAEYRLFRGIYIIANMLIIGFGEYAAMQLQQKARELGFAKEFRCYKASIRESYKADNGNVHDTEDLTSDYNNPFFKRATIVVFIIGAIIAFLDIM